MKKQIEGFIMINWREHAYTFESSDVSRFGECFCHYVLVGPANIEVEIPDDFNPVVGLIANLQLQKQLAAGLAIIGNVLPDSWKLSDELANITPIDPGSSNDNVSIRPPRPNQMDNSSLAHARVDIWLQARLMVLLFLIPIALICLIVIVIVRSSKTFFRWLSWALILSGFVSLIPVIVIAVSGVGGKAGGIHIYKSATGISEIALNSLAGGAIQSIVSTLVLGVLIQVAILIVVGLVAAFISILLTTPEPLLSDADLEAFIAAHGGSISTAASGTK